MNTKFFASALIAAAGFAAAPSFAADNIAAFGGEVGVPVEVSPSVSGLSREAVRNEYLQARRDGTLQQIAEGGDSNSNSNSAVATAKSTLTREAVRAEAVYAVHHGGLTVGEV
ncbi:DUF4148 domain-containing protein [Pseudorhodoferax sp.]|uniref:DUF4148 domain-containing protein n=1 Tax=Pseudorhodoferax sp. TaxID=1993553 RepID=UPI0039E4735D